jgi:hypothetical protein
MLNEMEMMTDLLGRGLRDLRISVTDRCNFRCRYCMPVEVFGPGYAFMEREELLTFEEIVTLVNPHFPALRSVPMALSGASRRKQIPSRQMKTAVESPDPARSRRLAEHSSFQRFSFQHFSFTQIPLFPRNPHFPALRSVPMALSGASRRKQIPSSHLRYIRLPYGGSRWF